MPLSRPYAFSYRAIEEISTRNGVGLLRPPKRTFQNHFPIFRSSTADGKRMSIVVETMHEDERPAAVNKRTISRDREQPASQSAMALIFFRARYRMLRACIERASERERRGGTESSRDQIQRSEISKTFPALPCHGRGQCRFSHRKCKCYRTLPDIVPRDIKERDRERHSAGGFSSDDNNFGDTYICARARLSSLKVLFRARSVGKSRVDTDLLDDIASKFRVPVSIWRRG